MYTATRPVFPCGSNHVLATVHEEAVKNPTAPLSSAQVSELASAMTFCEVTHAEVCDLKLRGVGCYVKPYRRGNQAMVTMADGSQQVVAGVLVGIYDRGVTSSSASLLGAVYERGPLTQGSPLHKLNRFYFSLPDPTPVGCKLLAGVHCNTVPNAKPLGHKNCQIYTS